MKVPFPFKQANKWLIYILLVGAAIGLANHFQGAFGGNILQSILINTFTSFGIGYPLVLLAYNENNLFRNIKSSVWRRFLQLLIFIFIGFFGTELEMIVRGKLLAISSYTFFGAGNTYILNIIITAILGYTMTYWINQLSKKSDISLSSNSNSGNNSNAALPIKIGKKVEFVKLEDIVFVEAADNYAYIYDSTGNKKLCDHSLGYLEKKLGQDFKRIHRKHIVNLNHIQSISHYNKGSYNLLLNHYPDLVINSGETYLDTIRQIIKL